MKARGTIRWFDFLSQEGIASLDGVGGIYINNDPAFGHLLNGGKWGGLFGTSVSGKPLYLDNGDFVECEVVENQASKIRLLNTQEIEDYLSDKLIEALEGENEIVLSCAINDILNCRETWTYRGMLIHLVPGPLLTETRIRSLKTTTKKSYLYADLPEAMRAMLSCKAKAR